MKKILMRVSLLAAIIIVLLAASALFLSNFIDANKYKGRISQLVYAKTGQVLVINGNMEWSLFPWIGLKANDLTYYNTPSFTPKIFISAKEMDIKIKLIPLITGNIEIGNVTLNNAVLNLIKNKSGKYNWEVAGKENKKENIKVTESSEQSSIGKLSIASLGIKSGKLNWYDQQKNSHTFINALNINSKHIQFSQPFTLSVEFELLNDDKTKNLAVALNTNLNLSSDYQHYSLQNIKLKGEYFVKKNKLDFGADGHLEIDLKKQNLLTDLNFTIDNLKGELILNGTDITKKLALYGTLSTDDFDLKQLLNNLGTPFDSKNSNSLKSVSLVSKIEFSNDSFKLNQLHAKVDKTDLFGNLDILSRNKNVHFNLNASEIVLDDYLSNKEGSAHSNESIEVADTQKTNSSPWSLNGVVKVTSLKSDKLKLSNIVATIDMRKKIIRVAPLLADFYKGKLDGSLTIDKHESDKTAIYIKQSLKNVDIKELLHEFSESDKLSGTTDVNVDLVSVMAPNSSFVSTLNGKLQLSLKNGSLRGVDVIYQLSRAHSFIKHLPSPSLSDSKQTNFSSLTANGVVTNGVINTDNLQLTSEYLKVNGKGTTNLVNKEVHYRLNALAEPKLADDNKDVGKEVTVYQVPIKVSGKLSKPNVNIDFAELAKTFLTKEIEKPIAEHIGKNINKLKTDLKDKVESKLKDFSPSGLFNKLTKHHDQEEQVNQENEIESAD